MLVFSLPQVSDSSWLRMVYSLVISIQGNLLLKAWQPCPHPTKHMGLLLHVIGNETPVKECPMVSNNVSQSPSMDLLRLDHSVDKPLPYMGGIQHQNMRGAWLPSYDLIPLAFIYKPTWPMWPSLRQCPLFPSSRQAGWARSSGRATNAADPGRPGSPCCASWAPAPLATRFLPKESGQSTTYLSICLSISINLSFCVCVYIYKHM